MKEQQAQALGEYLKTSLELDLLDLTHLNSLLQEERKTLESNQFDALDNINENKERLSLSLEKRSSQRNTELEARQLEGKDSQSWLYIIELIEKRTGLKLWSLWRKVESELKACDKMLKINEKIVAGMQHSANQFIYAIKQESGAMTTGTYSSKGDATKNVASNRPLSIA